MRNTQVQAAITIPEYLSLMITVGIKGLAVVSSPIDLTLTEMEEVLQIALEEVQKKQQELTEHVVEAVPEQQ